MTRFSRIRRRPDHWPTPHARARTRAAQRLDGPLGLAEASWLDAHLTDCAECSAVAAQYDTDRAALRSMRDSLPIPPRDLWARTAAAIEREAQAGPKRGSANRADRPFRGLPLPAISGLAVAVVVIALGAASTGLFGPPGGDVAAVPSADGGPLIAATDEPPSLKPVPTPLLADAGDVAWLRRDPDGALAFTNAPIDRVCPAESRATCATLDDGDESVLDLTVAPKSVIGSPVDDQAVVVSDDGEGGDLLVVVSLPDRRGYPPRQTPEPGATPSGSPAPTATATPAPTATAAPTPTTQPDPIPTPDPAASETPRPLVSPEPTVAATLALANDITLVGQSAAFSPDGSWFAFTARPTDGSEGADVYVWHVGDDQAIRRTVDGASTFASWAGNQVLVSRPADEAAEAGTAPQTVGIDPETGVETAFDGALWRPSISPSGTRAVAWVGTIAFDAANQTWRPAEGRLELIAWPPADPASPDSGAEPPTGQPVQVVASGPAWELDVRWDETSEWLAVWVADSTDSEIGRLTLFRIDPATGRLDQPADAPTEEPALAGFSIGDGRLAWVGPTGEDGEGSYIHVAAWVGRDVGTAESVPGQGIVVVR